MTSAVAVRRPPSWAERAALTAVFLVNGLGVGAWAACIPSFKERLLISNGALAAALFAFAAGAVLAMAFAARLATRFGSAAATKASAALFAASLLCPLFAANLAELAVAAFAMGVANGLLDVTMNAQASVLERQRGVAIMSSFHAAFSAGGLSGAALGALAGFSVVATLGVASGLAAIFAAAAWPALREVGPAPQSAGLSLALPGRALAPLCAVAMLGMACEGAMADWTGVYLKEIVKAPLDDISAGYAAFSGAMVAGRLSGDRLVRAFGRMSVVCWGGLLAAGGLALAVITPGVATATAGFALVGIGLSNVIPAVFSAAAGLAAAPAVGVAMAATAGYAGLLGGPAVIGAVAEIAGLRAALALLIVCAGAAAVVARSVRE